MQIWHIFITRVGVITARKLGRALHQVSQQQRLPQLIPLGIVPAKLVFQGANEQSRIRHTSRDDDIRSLIQRVAYRIRAEINVGGDDAAVQRAQRCLPVPERTAVIVLHPR